MEAGRSSPCLGIPGVFLGTGSADPAPRTCHLAPRGNINRLLDSAPMHVRSGFGETLPALLRRRHGIPERATLLAAAALALLVVAGYLVVHDPLDGRTQRVHRSAPVFNVLYRAGVVRPVAPQGPEYQRYAARTGRVDATVAVAPLELPPFRGNVSGELPVSMETRVAALQARLPGFEVVDEGRARIGGAPGYEVDYRFRDGRRRATGRDVLLLPQDTGARRGVVVSLRVARGPRALGPKGRAAITAAKSTVRSFKFGAGRGD